MNKQNDPEEQRLISDERSPELVTEELLDCITDSLLVLTSDLRILHANRTFCETFHVTATQILGQPVYDLSTELWHRPAVRNLLASASRSVKAVECLEVEGVFPTVGPRSLRLNVRRVARRDSRSPLILLTLHDATERKLLLDDLHAFQDRYKTLVDTTQEGVWTIDAAGNTTFANRNMAAMLGTTSEELIGKPSFEYVFEEDRERAAELFRKKISGDREPFEFRLRRSDGSWFWASVTGTRFHDASGETVDLLGTFRDISEQKLAEEAATQHASEVARSAADLQSFAYIASHDLREPLRIMRVYAQLLLRRYGGSLDSDADRFLQFIESGAERMDKLVHDLLTYSQATERDGNLAAQVNLAKTVGWAKSNLATRIAASAAEIAHEELPTVYGDELQFVQLFQHLLSNSIKYRRPDVPPRVHISAEFKNEEWVISVTDNGIGIPQNRWEYIFGMFKRLHGSEIPGTGIGLAICRKISQNHGGRIWVKSEPGQGSTFFVTIPAHARPT